MEITRATTVGEIAAEFPATARVFEKHGIDFCCGGARALFAVCEELGQSFDGLKEELLAEVDQDHGRTPSFTGATMSEVILHILTRYHRRLWQDLPRLAGWAEKVLNAHGARHPESVPAMCALVRELRAHLEPHLLLEEDILFPFLQRRECTAAAGRFPVSDTSDGTLLEQLGAEHETVGTLLRQLREVTNGFTPPEGACNTFRALYSGLLELEKEIHEHVHLENNVLFLKARRIPV
ncbi:MAG: Iron-sulfur cluster repair protein YtfE [Thermoanaerobaculia bacterium]|nr:Iron-sulfur cluster repair protein YtfE [Thermoanaerobaculia bacterium]